MGRKEIFLQFLFITYCKSAFAMADFDISSWASKPPWSSASPSRFSKAGFSLQTLPPNLLGENFAYPCVYRAQNPYRREESAEDVGDVSSESLLSINISNGSENLLLRHRLYSFPYSALYMNPILCFSRMISTVKFQSKDIETCSRNVLLND